MLAIISLLLVITLSILITRIATVALTHTGLSRESARFQARSAFTGVGFTTAEAERVVNHPVRRRILMTLMLLGNAGIVTVVSSLVIGFANVDEDEPGRLTRLLVLAIGGVLLLALARSRWVDHWLSLLISRALKRWTTLDVRDYAELLRLSGGYGVRELRVRPDDWVEGRRLGELALRDEGLVVLAIDRTDGTYVPAPKGGTVIERGDRLVVYGDVDVIERLDQRRKGPEGDAEHRRLVAHQHEVEHVQESRDESRHHQGGSLPH